jgi:hypothetical protein
VTKAIISGALHHPVDRQPHGALNIKQKSQSVYSFLVVGKLIRLPQGIVLPSTYDTA